MERPKLGKLKPGDPVLIRVPGRYVPDNMRWRRGTVEGVARVWIEVRPEGWGRTQRFRLDTQDDGSGRGNRYCFVTPEQHAYDERVRAARKTLTDAGVRLDYHSPFSRDDAAVCALAERVAQLVALIKAPS
jgi:hypothetical protein